MENVYASVDLGGTKLACAFATADGTIQFREQKPTQAHEGPEAVISRIAELTQELASKYGQPPTALGIGIPGLVDRQQGITRFLPNLPTQWRDVPVRDMLEPVIGCPVYLLNDVRTATLGELTYGHGKTANTMAFFAIGTGIGGGVAVDGKLRLGLLGAAGELGHQTIIPDGSLCGCGNRGCLETLASGPAITGQGIWLMRSGRAPVLYDLVGGDAAKVTPKEMAQAATAGDESVRDVLVRAATYLGIGVANVVTILHPDLIILGGSVANIGELLFDTVRQTVKKRVGMFPTENIRILPSLLGVNAGTLGGIALAINGDALS
jgi:glucokinase